MNTTHDNLRTAPGPQPSELARRRLLSRRGEPLFLADWDRALFIHFEADAAALQRDVPFPLDLFEGKAYVSLVAFTMWRMRFRFGGRLGDWLCRPVATSDFLNVRTYVRHRGEAGIYFLGEWLSNRLGVRLGPVTFGLPYRAGRMEYRHASGEGHLKGTVRSTETEKELKYEGVIEPGAGFGVCAAGSLDEFLVERYTAFTAHGSRPLFFRIWHEPWHQTRVAEIRVIDRSLVTDVWPWFSDARLAGANYSPGVPDVWMGWPHRISAREMEPPGARRLSGLFELP